MNIFLSVYIYIYIHVYIYIYMLLGPVDAVFSSYPILSNECLEFHLRVAMFFLDGLKHVETFGYFYQEINQTSIFEISEHT